LKVIGILGSPRRGGNSEVLLDKALEGARQAGCETGKIVLNELDFRPCQECEYMPENGRCHVQDEMQKVYPLVEEADAVILATPVFFGSVSAQTKMMIDRYQCWWRAKYMLKTVKAREKKRPGLFLCVSAGDRQDFFDNARSIVKNFFATIDVKFSGEVNCPGVENKGDILKREDCLEKAYNTGKGFAE